MARTGDDPGTSTRRALLAGTGAAGAAALTGCGGDERGARPPTGASAGTAGPASATGSAATGSAATGSAATGGPAASARGGGIKAADIPVNGGRVFPDLGPDGAVVTQPAAGQFKAFSATCTHRGCTLASVSDGTINCPCHGARYSIRDGSVVQPGDGIPAATRPLAVKRVTVSGDGLIVG